MYLFQPTIAGSAEHNINILINPWTVNSVIILLFFILRHFRHGAGPIVARSAVEQPPASRVDSSP